MTAQELLIYVILHEIRGGAVRIVFTGFGTLVIKADSGPSLSRLRKYIQEAKAGLNIIYWEQRS